MGAVWGFLTVYCWPALSFALGALLIICGVLTGINKSGAIRDADAWPMGILAGLLGVGFVYFGIASSVATFESQSLNIKEVEAVMSEGGCVSQALRLSLQEANAPLSRYDLDLIRNTCEKQEEKAAAEARTQDILDQQRSVADLKDSQDAEGE